MLLFLLLFLVFSIPAVQTWFAHKATDFVNEKYGTDLSINKINLGLTGNINASGVFIKDTKGDTLILANKVSTSVVSFANMYQGKTSLSNTSIDGVYVKMITYQGEELDSFRQFLKSFATSKTNKPPFYLSLQSAAVSNGTYLYINKNIDSKPIVDFKYINFFTDNLVVNGTDVDFHTNAFSFLYKNQIEVNNLVTDFQYVPGKISLQNISLSSEEESQLNGDFSMSYGAGDMSDFYNKVKLNATVKNSTLATNDLRLFYKEFGRGHKLQISTQFDGTMNDFSLQNLQLKGLSQSKILGDLRLQNSMSKNKLQDFRVTGKLKDLSSTKIDLSNLLPNVVGVHLPKEIEKFGKITAIGAINASPSSVLFKGGIETEIGVATANIKLSNLLEKEKLNYKGLIQVTNFDLRSYSGNALLGNTSFDIEVDGSGFLLNNLNTYIAGDFTKFEYKNYAYKDITVLGKLKYPLFDGKIIAGDPNFDLTFEGLVNLKKNENDYNFKADVNRINFASLNLFQRDSVSVFKGNVEANLKGTNLDDTYGTIHFRNTLYVNQNETFSFKDFQLDSNFSETGERTIKVNSPDIIEGKAYGKFSVNNIKNLFQNSLASLYKNYEASINTENEYVNFNFQIYNKIIGAFFTDVKLGANTRIQGSVDNNGSKFNLDFHSPKISYKNNEFQNVDLEINNSNPTNTILTVQNFMSDAYNLSDLKLTNVNRNDTLFNTTTFKGGEKLKDSFDIRLFHTINTKRNSVIGIQKTLAHINNYTWLINKQDQKKHHIEFDNNFKDILVDSIKISHREEQMVLNGKIKDSTYKKLNLSFTNVDLRKITKPIKNFDYTGIIDGNLNLLQKNNLYLPTSDLTIKDLTVNELYIGNLDLNAIGNKDLTQYSINAWVDNKGKRTLELEGLIDASISPPQVNFDVSVREFNLEPFSDLGGIVLSDLRGKAFGKVSIKGDYANPDFNGSLILNDAGVKIPYLNVDLDLDNGSEVALSNKELTFVSANITDTKYKTKGVLEGVISHDKFKQWNLDLAISSGRLLVLDTSEKDNELYYGTAFIDGKATIKGPTDQLKITIQAASAEGTQFKIPISDTETIGDNSFIHFITPEEKIAIAKGEKVYFEDVKGLELEFDLDLNKNAEVEVVIDKESGSTLKGYGAGTLLIQINTNGKFNMWGDFVAYKGTYDFKYGGIVSKRFDVRTGNISWDGSPTAAKLDLSAVYKTNANPNIILENSVINRKIPVEVITTLTGELLKPDLNFDIDFPSASSIVKSELDYVLSDRTTKERQAFSLITQGQFYSDALIGNNLITGNLVEKASDLVSSILSDEEDKFDIGFNYNPADRTNLENQISDEFGVSVSTQISNRILINGKVGIPVGGVTESVVVGDIRIDFLLNEDGTLRANIFNRENDLQFIGEANGYTQGVGLSYSYDFNTFKELIREIFQKGKNKSK